MNKNELFERIKKNAIKSVKHDLKQNKERIKGIYDVIILQENRLKQIPKEIEESKAKIELLEGQMEIMAKGIADIEGFELLEET